MPEEYRTDKDYAIYVFSGSYDVPTKGTDGAWMEGSEEVYDFIICSIAPLAHDYELGSPEFGFLYPAFSDRSSDNTCIDIYNKEPEDTQVELMKLIYDPEAALKYMIATYEGFVTSKMSVNMYKRFIELISEDRGKGVLWHCTAGKDWQYKSRDKGNDKNSFRSKAGIY